MQSLVVVMVWLAFASNPAVADETRADALFEQGKQLVAALKFDDACTAFEASQLLDPRVTTLVNLGDCRERNREYASAFSAYLQAERELRAKRDPSSKSLRKLVRSRAQQLAPRLSSLKVTMPPEMIDVQIIRNGERLERDEWNRDMPVDGGTYRIMARSGDVTLWSTTVTVGVANDRRVVDVPRSLAAR